MFLCYLIYNNSSRTYIGYTNNFKKRICQHNGEISGGAKYTTSNKGVNGWTPIILVTGIEDKRLALSLEWRMKKRRNKLGKLKPSFGLESRVRNIFEILDEDVITSNSLKPSSIENIVVIINENYKDFFYNLKIPTLNNLPANTKIEFLKDNLIKEITDGLSYMPNEISNTGYDKST